MGRRACHVLNLGLSYFITRRRAPHYSSDPHASMKGIKNKSFQSEQRSFEGIHQRVFTGILETRREKKGEGLESLVLHRGAGWGFCVLREFDMICFRRYKERVPVMIIVSKAKFVGSLPPPAQCCLGSF